MALYVVTIGNTMDDTTKVELILSYHPLTIDNVPKYLLGISEDWGEYIYSVEPANILLCPRDEEEENEMENLIEQL